MCNLLILLFAANYLISFPRGTSKNRWEFNLSLKCRSWLTHRSIYRSSFDRQPSDTLVERPPMSADISTVISLVAYRSTIDQQQVSSVLYHLIIQRELTASPLIQTIQIMCTKGVRGRVSINTFNRYPPSTFDQYLMDTPLIPRWTRNQHSINILVKSHLISIDSYESVN